MRVLTSHPQKGRTAKLKTIAFCLVAGPIYQRAEDRDFASTQTCSTSQPIRDENTPCRESILRFWNPSTGKHEVSCSEREALIASSPASYEAGRLSLMNSRTSVDAPHSSEQQYIHKKMRFRHPDKFVKGENQVNEEPTSSSQENPTFVKASGSQLVHLSVPLAQSGDDSEYREPILGASSKPRVDASCKAVVDISDEAVVDISDEAVVDISDESNVDISYRAVVDISDEPNVDTLKKPVVDISDESTPEEATSVSPSCQDLYQRLHRLVYRWAEVPSELYQFLNFLRSAKSKRRIDASMLNLLYLRSREKCRFDHKAISYWTVQFQLIKDSATSASVKLMCDWLWLMTRIGKLSTFVESIRRRLDGKYSVVFPKVATHLRHLLAKHKGLDKAIRLEGSRKEELDERRIWGNLESSRFTIMTTLPPIFQRPECEHLLELIEKTEKAFPHNVRWVKAQKKCLLRLLATAGNIVQFMENRSTEADPPTVLVSFFKDFESSFSTAQRF
eukprot:Blabericola_migrator_1__6599@NODE_3329_length_1852_cov_54_634174_g2083_i0_p1_GENE_NODE_3329_length_1852_cov_54_634174_g2083_i0NODE_3329_length_1852_cov_54_634174_g2083_i0_p1_ORF_typecomplete_len505_score69_15_NODE_3329_length_1852_cov_54_634174_g2083_i01571671